MVSCYKGNDDVFQTGEFIHAILQSPLYCLDEGFFRVDPLQDEQTAQLVDSPTPGAFFEFTHIDIQALVVAGKQRFFPAGTRGLLPDWRMMGGISDPGLFVYKDPGMLSYFLVLIIDLDGVPKM